MSNSTTNSVADHCEAARILAASKLAAIVNACAAEACGDKTSVPHARFVLEIAQLAAASPIEKKSKSAEEIAEPEDGEPKPKCLTEIFLDTLNELRVHPVK